LCSLLNKNNAEAEASLCSQYIQAAYIHKHSNMCNTVRVYPKDLNK